MLKLDEFESAFKAASKARFEFEAVQLKRLLVVTDIEGSEQESFVRSVLKFASAFSLEGHQVLTKKEYDNVEVLLERVKGYAPQLICTYRNLGTDGWRYHHSLGEDVDVLSQASPCPTLLMPHPRSERRAEQAAKDTSCVMVVADHLTGDDRLVNYGHACTQPGGSLYLTHVEAASNFDYYMSIIEKIPELDTDDAQQLIKEQLLKEPTEYIQSVVEALAEAKNAHEVKCESAVLMGHRLVEYRRLIQEKDVDLLVMNAKDPKHVAMHPMAYPLAVELDHIAQLLL